jgi:uncharacterized membrane protein
MDTWWRGNRPWVGGLKVFGLTAGLYSLMAVLPMNESMVPALFQGTLVGAGVLSVPFLISRSSKKGKEQSFRD